MSGRRNGSPPVNTTRGGGSPKARMRARRAFPSSVVSSRGSRRAMASARQWTQASAQARVVSQIAMKGVTEKGDGLIARGLLGGEARGGEARVGAGPEDGRGRG